MSLPTVNPSNIIEIAAAYGVTLTPQQEDGLPVLIERAQSLLPASVEARLASGRLTAAAVVSVIEDMVVRVLRNIRGLRQISIDDYSATIDSAISSGQLYLSASERARLVGRRGARVGSIQLHIPAHRVP